MKQHAVLAGLLTGLMVSAHCRTAAAQSGDIRMAAVSSIHETIPGFPPLDALVVVRLGDYQG